MAGDVDREEFLAGVVEGKVLRGLKETELADGFRRDSAGGEVGDGTGGELQADVGDIDLAAEDGKADGADLLDGGCSHGEENVEVVDHEVQDDVDVERARSEDAEAMGLKEHGTGEALQGSCDGGVEAFKVAGGKDAAEAFGLSDEQVSLKQGGGKRFFDEHVETGGEQLFSDRGVGDGGNADGGGVKAESCGEEIVDRGEGWDVKADGGFGAGVGIGVDDCGEPDEQGLLLRFEDRGCEVVRGAGREIGEDAEVVAAERTGTDDRDANRFGANGIQHGYLVLAGASTALRQRA